MSLPLDDIKPGEYVGIKQISTRLGNFVTCLSSTYKWKIELYIEDNGWRKINSLLI